VPRRLLIGAALLGLLTAVVAVPLNGLVAEGLPLSRLTDGQVLDASLGTRTGGAWGVRTLAWLAALVVLAVPWATRLRMALLALPAGVLVATVVIAGHASAESPRGVLAPADVVHVLAAGTWLGGLVLLIAVFWRRSRETTLDAGAARATHRFSTLALPAVVLLVASGVAQAWFYAGDISRLTTTTWGIALLCKVALLTTIVAVAARNRFAVGRLMGRSGSGDDPARDARRLRIAMRGEVALAVIVLGATAILVRAAPPASEAAAPPDLKMALGPMEGQVILQPATTGPNAVTVHLFDRKTGKPARHVKELTLRLSMPDKGIGPLKVKLKRQEAGHYQAPAQSLPATGTWRMELDARVSQFDQYTAKRSFEVSSRG
jgi:copper transport protein